MMIALQALKPGADTELNSETLEAIAEDAPSAALPKNEVEGNPLTDILVAVKMQPSKGAVRRCAYMSTLARKWCAFLSLLVSISSNNPRTSWLSLRVPPSN